MFWRFVIFALKDFSLPFQKNSERKKDILSPFLFKARKKFLSFGLFSLLLLFLCCHELIFWRVINLKYWRSPSRSRPNLSNAAYIAVPLSCLLGFSRESRRPRMSKKAANRWFLAVTLLRNPSLVKSRRQGRHITASVVTHGCVNVDVQM